MASIPGTICGGGSKDTYVHKNILAVRFHAPLASKVTIHAFDNAQTFPAVDSVVTTDNDIFGLSNGAELSMIGCIDYTGGTKWSPGTNWFPTEVKLNTCTLNLLKGYTSYVTQHGATIDSSGGGTIYFTLQLKIPASCQTSSTTKFDVAFKYSYTSTVPNPSIFFNSKTGGGSEAVPVWATLVSGASGIYHSAADLASSPYLANIPLTGQEKTQDMWVSHT